MILSFAWEVKERLLSLRDLFSIPSTDGGNTGINFNSLYDWKEALPIERAEADKLVPLHRDDEILMLRYTVAQRNGDVTNAIAVATIGGQRRQDNYCLQYMYLRIMRKDSEIHNHLNNYLLLIDNLNLLQRKLVFSIHAYDEKYELK